ncbi:unnamed protein product [Calypogeia fissa]
MAMKDMFRWMKWKNHKLTVVFFLATTFCLLLLLLVHFTPDGIAKPYGDCPRTSSSSPREENSFISTETKQPQPQSQQPQQGETVVKVVEEWQFPSVQDDRPHEELTDLESFEQPRRYMPMGSSAFLYIQFGAYRIGPNAFAVVGLAPKFLHKEGNPGFDCSWVSSGGDNNSTTVKGWTSKHKPDWGLGMQYSVVVVHCTFSGEVGADGSGGRLEFVATHGTSDHTGLPDAHWVALKEDPNEYDGSVFVAPYKYDYLYCGSPIFGSISPQRIREWIAYHVWRFGPRSHFVLYDAGGIHEGVRKILQPWVEKGFVSVFNIRQQSRYEQYYYSQFLVVNDCLLKGKTLANWTFFFDVDEYIYVPEPFTFDQVMMEYANMGRRAQQVHFKQNFMSHFHCRNESLDAGVLQRRWMIEKLVYRRTQHTKRWGFPNRKYAIQAQYASSTGVHNSMDTSHPQGMGHKETVIVEDFKLSYNHYHHTVDRHDEICKEFVNPTLTTMELFGPTGLDGPPTPPQLALHVLDTGMAALADAVREFENRTVGEQPFLL